MPEQGFLEAAPETELIESLFADLTTSSSPGRPLPAPVRETSTVAPPSPPSLALAETTRSRRLPVGGRSLADFLAGVNWHNQPRTPEPESVVGSAEALFDFSSPEVENEAELPLIVGLLTVQTLFGQLNWRNEPRSQTARMRSSASRPEPAAPLFSDRFNVANALSDFAW